MTDTDHYRAALAQWNGERLADALPALTTDDLSLAQFSEVLRLCAAHSARAGRPANPRQG